MSADNMRYRYGETNPVQADVATGQQVNIGDLAGYSGNTVTRAADTAWAGSLAATQAAFAAEFLGVSGQRKMANVPNCGPGGGDANKIRIATTGVFEYAIQSGTYALGTLVGPDKDVGNSLLSQQVVPVSDTAHAIGKITAQYDAATTAVKVKVLTKVAAPIGA